MKPQIGMPDFRPWTPDDTLRTGQPDFDPLVEGEIPRIETVQPAHIVASGLLTARGNWANDHEPTANIIISGD